MEANTQALEVVCKHFSAEYGDQTIAELRKQKAKAHASNYRLRKKVAQLEERVVVLRDRADRFYRMWDQQYAKNQKAICLLEKTIDQTCKLLH